MIASILDVSVKGRGMECDENDYDLVIIPFLNPRIIFYSGFLASCECMPNGSFIEYKLYDDSKHLEKHFAYLKSPIELWFKCYSMSRLMIIY